MINISRRSFVKKGTLAGTLLGINPFSKMNHPLSFEKEKKRMIYIFSKNLQWLDYKEMAKTAAQIGFDGVDLTVRPNGHVEPGNVETDLPKAVEAIRREGIQIDTITTAIVNIQDTYTESIIKTAAANGIKQYRLGWIEYNDLLDFEQNIVHIHNQLKELESLNNQYGIRGDYQNHSGTMFGSAILDLWHILRELDSRWIASRYDIRHAVAEGSASWPVALKAILPYIRSLDIKDFSWKNNNSLVPESVPLGTGLVDFKKYLEICSKSCESASMTMHFEYPLGGAENGEKKLQVSPDSVINAMKKDLNTLKGFLSN